MIDMQVFFATLLFCAFMVLAIGGMFVAAYHRWLPFRVFGGIIAVLAFSAIMGIAAYYWGA